MTHRHNKFKNLKGLANCVQYIIQRCVKTIYAPNHKGHLISVSNANTLLT